MPSRPACTASAIFRPALERSSVPRERQGRRGDTAYYVGRMPRRDEYEAAARAVAGHLAERQRPDGGFPGPDHYGVTAAVWLWSHFGAEFVAQMDRAWDRLKGDPPATHGEFNTYALLQCRERLGAGPVDALVRRLRFGGRHSANWMLLRAVCRALPGPRFSPLQSSLGARAALIRYARRGFIADRPGVRSFAYHAFCGALLADLWKERRARWAGVAAARAAHFAARFVLPNGDGMYVGRGQQQIFGYGALLYLLEAAAQLTGEDVFSEAADRAFSRLMQFQRGDGSFPLVLREGEPAEPWSPDAPLPGWYSYNRYADYLPFLGCFLLKAARPNAPSLGQVAPAGPHPELRVWRQARYVAVLAAPGGASTNDMAFPYVCCGGQSLFPCYGAEGDQAPAEAAPLPYATLAAGQQYAFRERLRYRLTDTGLTGASRLVHHVRDFDFGPAGFACRDRITFRRRCSFSQFVPANFPLRALRRAADGTFETWHRGARVSLELHPDGSSHPDVGVSASGPLVALRHAMGRVEARAGDVVSTELRVRFL